MLHRPYIWFLGLELFTDHIHQPDLSRVDVKISQASSGSTNWPEVVNVQYHVSSSILMLQSLRNSKTSRSRFAELNHQSQDILFELTIVID